MSDMDTILLQMLGLLDADEGFRVPDEVFALGLELKGDEGFRYPDGTLNSDTRRKIMQTARLL